MAKVSKTSYIKFLTVHYPQPKGWGNKERRKIYMNKLLTKIVGVVLGTSMAVGVGTAVVAKNAQGINSEVQAATGSATITGGTVVDSMITWSIASGNITVISRSGGGNAVANTNRLYRYNYMEFTATNNYTITSLEITYSTNYRGANNAGGTAITNNRISAGQSNVTVTDTNVSGGKITVTPDSTANTHFYFQNAATGSDNVQLRWSEFKVNYSYESSTPSVLFNNPTDAVGVGSSVTNAATGDYLGGASISYSSDDTSVATVDSGTGEVTGVAFGSTTITATATVNGVDYSDDYTIYVTSSSTAYYTVAQARAAIDSGKGLTGQYVKGVVYKVDSYNSTYHSVTYWISDNGSNSVPFEVYSGLGIGGANFSSIDDVKVGDIVVVTGELKKNSSTYEFNYNNELVSQIHVASIDVKTAPSDVSYNEGEYFNPTGLIVTATYDDTPNPTTMDFAYSDLGSSFTFDPTTSTTLTNQSSVSISLFGKTTSQAITVTGRTITGITVTGDMTNKTYVKDAAWDLTGLSLTVAYNDGDPAVIALKDLTAGTDFTLSKATADGTTSLTISGTYDGHSITSRTITGITYTSEVTWDATAKSSSTLVLSESGLSLTLSSGTLNNNTDYRVYKSATATIASSGENIRKIEFTGTSANPISGMVLTSGGGELSTEGYDGTWLGDSSSIVFTASTAQTRIVKMIITTQSGYAEVHVNGLTVDGSAASIGQEFNIEIIKTKTYELDVAVTPDNTSDSKAINYSVSSGSGATVDANGVITAGSTAGATAVIRAESDADSTYYVLFNVIVIDSKTVYRLGFSHETSGDSNTAVTTSTWSNFATEDVSALTCTDTARVYPAHYTAFKFGGSSNGGTITLQMPNSVDIERVIIHAKNYGTDSASVAINSGTSQALTEEYKYYVFDLGTASDEVTIASASTSKCRFYVDDIVFVAGDNQAAVGAYGYAAAFMNALDEECSNLEVSTSTWSTLSGNWTTMGANYSGSQAYFLAKTASPRDGDGLTPTGDVIQKALARYDFIVGKYNKGQGLTAYTDFMNRDPDAIGSSIRVLNNIVSNTAVSTTVVIISVLAITTLGGYFLLRKRKEER